MLRDLRPYLRGIAGEIARQSDRSGEKLSSLVAKVASAKAMPDDMIKTLSFETNQAYRSIFNKDDFELSKMPEVMDFMHSREPLTTKVAYAYKEYEITSPTVELDDMDLLPDETKTDFKAVFRELSRKSASEAKQKRASTYLDSEEHYSDLQNNLSILKTIGFQEQEICDSLNSVGSFTPSHVKYASDIFNSLSKRASSTDRREFYNVEGYLKNVQDSLSKFASSVEEFMAADIEYKKAKTAQDVTYKQARILL